MRFGNFGIWELLIILVVVLLIFGPRRLPEMAKGIGQSVREFRKGIKDIRDDITSDDDKSTDKSTKTSAATSTASQASTDAGDGEGKSNPA